MLIGKLLSISQDCLLLQIYSKAVFQTNGSVLLGNVLWFTVLSFKSRVHFMLAKL